MFLYILLLKHARNTRVTVKTSNGIEKQSELPMNTVFSNSHILIPYTKNIVVSFYEESRSSPFLIIEDIPDEIIDVIEEGLFFQIGIVDIVNVCEIFQSKKTVEHLKRKVRMLVETVEKTMEILRS